MQYGNGMHVIDIIPHSNLVIGLKVLLKPLNIIFILAKVHIAVVVRGATL